MLLVLNFSNTHRKIRKHMGLGYATHNQMLSILLRLDSYLVTFSRGSLAMMHMISPSTQMASFPINAKNLSQLLQSKVSFFLRSLATLTELTRLSISPLTG